MYSIRARRDIADNGDTEFAAKWQSSNLYIWGAHNNYLLKFISWSTFLCQEHKVARENELH